jgi:hypothetical protein
MGAGVPALTFPVTAGASLPPRSVTVVSGFGHALLRWRAPHLVNGSTVTGYTVAPYVGTTPLPSENLGPDARYAIVSGLQVGRIYTFEVFAKNARGMSDGAPSGAVKVK